MSTQESEHHILLINMGEEQQSIILDAATYSIGRDSKNAIVLPVAAISREHALLLRVPLPDTCGYRYQLVDGNAAGQPSKNGIQVNGQRCQNHDLHKGDVIVFGKVIQAAYLVVHMSDEALADFLQSKPVDFQSIKQPPTNTVPTEILSS